MSDNFSKTDTTPEKRFNRTSFQSPVIEGGKLPPQALELEEAVLGAIMLESDVLTDVMDILQPDAFYKDANKKIYECILELSTDSQPIDLLTVSQKLRTKGELEIAGGHFYLSQLTTKVASGANAEFHARIIVEKFIQRSLIKVSSQLTKKAYEDSTDVLELLDSAQQELFNIAEGNIKKSFTSLSELMEQAIKQIEDAKNSNTDGVSGVPTGFTALDKVTSGWQNSDLIIIAARPAMGKTAFVLSMARNVAVDFKMPVALFSLEMSSLQLVTRLIASETGIPQDKIRRGNLAEHEYAQLHSKIEGLSQAPLFIDDTPALSVLELRAKCRRLAQQHHVKLIIIDYLQLMTAGGNSAGNRVLEISIISRSLKIIAKELAIPVIALSQLSRNVEARGGDKRPMLSDLRESGSIEQDADIVSFIYRPEYYGMLTDEDGASLENVGEIMIAKHRNGSVENVKLKFIKELAKFTNLDGDHLMHAGGDPFNANAGMLPTGEFDDNYSQPQSITRQSKMNDHDDDFAADNDAPF